MKLSKYWYKIITVRTIMIKKLLSYLKPKCQFEAYILKNKPQTISEVENLMRIYTQTKFN